jgi:hypothetical protein
MSLQATANLLQQQGRGNDKMLVHMTPREVAGLEAIARAKGGELTINPKTGLPEAGFLDDILPIAASAALMYFAPGLGASIGSGLGLGTGALAQGVGMGLLTGGATALLTGDINKGLQTGLTSGILSGGMAALSGPSTVDMPTSNVQTSTPALTAEAAPQTWADMAAGSAEGFTPGQPYNVYPSDVAGPPKSAMTTDKGFFGNLSPKEKLGYGLAGTTALSLLGGMQDKGEATPTDKGTIRPYEYSTAMRTPQDGQTQYFQPIQYDLAGRSAQPIDTSERNYFEQGYKALPTYQAAMGGQVPQLNNMPSGGLAAIEGMRDGYGPMTTNDGAIPQFSNGGQAEESKDDLLSQYKKLRALNIQIEPKIAELADQKMKYSDEEQNMLGRYLGMPERVAEQNMRMSQPEMTRGIGQNPMGMVEGSQMMDRMRGSNQTPDVSLMPQSLNPKNLAGMGAINKQLDDDTRLKLMASGYRNQMGSGINRAGAGVTRQLDKDSDLSAFYERSPGTRDQMGGVRYSRRFNQGGMSEGDLGGYSDGGRMLKGPGDGVSDSIPATINDKQPARLADGEFVIPARIVSELGNGSTDAGAKRLYDMMDRIQAGRSKTVGKGKVAVDSNAKKYLPA